MLYPLKFKPILKEKIWGGNKLKNQLNKDCDLGLNIGESWEISAVNDEISVVANGDLAGRDIIDITNEFKGELLGEKVYEMHGLSFPLLVKFIDAHECLSVQVHPDDETAKFRHGTPGKTEMWYVMDAEKDSELILGFKSRMSTEIVNESISSVCLEDLLNKEKVREGDVFFIPAGCVHSIGLGILIAEIQQSSDVTYRLYDYNRKDVSGNSRELHLDLAEDVMNLSGDDNCRVNYNSDNTGFSNVVSCKYFSTNILHLDKYFFRDYSSFDSFVILMCVYGDLVVKYGEGRSINVVKGETVLIPACLKQVELLADKPSKMLEIYID